MDGTVATTRNCHIDNKISEIISYNRPMPAMLALASGLDFRKQVERLELQITFT